MNRDLEFAYEIGAIRLIQRHWHRFHLPTVGDLADHHFRVLWLSLIIAAREKASVNYERMMKMALVHDIAESRGGDVDYLSRQYVTRHEELGIADILADTSLEEEFLTLWHEYEKRECLESKIVKDADNLDVDLEIREQASMGSQLAGDWAESREAAGRKLYTKTALELQTAIKNSNPHDWHTKSPRNRVNGGDWKDATTKKENV
ncbi:MAG TPA: HD domain-containing protein [Candidatus Saccharimonadales bacterium]|nr:HD domain-containing protein [Candidatus Saccharimonadales bacterium]